MSCRALDRYLEEEQHRDLCACCECGYMRGSGHHPRIRCPVTGRCGDCGNDWPCPDHMNLARTCVACGYIGRTRHHAGIRCPKTGKCGDCGGSWPCHIHPVDKRKTKEA
jgi:hypothetical protein